jgi:hypothetical protein
MLKLMYDATVPASVRIRASECVLNHANKTIEIEDIEVRVAALEAARAAAFFTATRRERMAGTAGATS